MIKTHKIKLNPTQEQERYFYRASGVARFAWNWALDEYKRRKETGKKADWNQIKIQFRANIDVDYPFVKQVTKCAAEQAIEDLRQAINSYYKANKSNPKSKIKFPSYRKRSKKVGGFGLNNDQFCLDENFVRVPKLGHVNMAEAVRFNGKVMSGRIKEHARQWYLIVAIETQQPAQRMVCPQRSVGIDFGLSAFATLSDGSQSQTQAHYRIAERKLKRLQRGLARKKKGSNNRSKWKLKIARAHQRISNLRNDFLHQFTSNVVNRFSVIGVEELCLKGWVALNGKSTQDAGVAKAVAMLGYKSQQSGAILQKIGRFFPSSKTCHRCGYVKDDLNLSDRTWICPQCQTEHNRDFNAAINLELEGVRLLVGSGFLDVTTVEFAASTLRSLSMQAADCEAVRM